MSIVLLVVAHAFSKWLERLDEPMWVFFRSKILQILVFVFVSALIHSQETSSASLGYPRMPTVKMEIVTDIDIWHPKLQIQSKQVFSFVVIEKSALTWQNPNLISTSYHQFLSDLALHWHILGFVCLSCALTLGSAEWSIRRSYWLKCK